MRESRTYGSVRGARCEARPYRDRQLRWLAMTMRVGARLTRSATVTAKGVTAAAPDVVSMLEGLDPTHRLC
jgi:hypothetical protein